MKSIRTRNRESVAAQRFGVQNGSGSRLGPDLNQFPGGRIVSESRLAGARQREQGRSRGRVPLRQQLQTGVAHLERRRRLHQR